ASEPKICEIDESRENIEEYSLPRTFSFYDADLRDLVTGESSNTLRNNDVGATNMEVVYDKEFNSF
ncbi:17135_t:CDS:1, partial [Racocetra fulgida]